MNRTLTLAAGVLFTVLFSLCGLVLIPNWKFRELKPHTNDDGVTYPLPPSGDVKLGRVVYADLGCVYCHSQQVRPASFGADIDRGWGVRRSVARDYMYDKPHFLGTMRTGPDLANIGARQSSRDWHYIHLYDPQLTTPGSIMPPHSFLFERHETDGPLPPGAIKLPAREGQRPAYIVPNQRARVLVEYLRSLDQSHELPEAQ